VTDKVTVPALQAMKRGGRKIVGVVCWDPASAEVADAAGDLVRELGSAATVAVGLTKLLVHRSLNVDLEHHLADEGLAMELVSRSDDFHENVRAKRDKRAPDFRGR